MFYGGTINTCSTVGNLPTPSTVGVSACSTVGVYLRSNGDPFYSRSVRSESTVEFGDPLPSARQVPFGFVDVSPVKNNRLTSPIVIFFYDTVVISCLECISILENLLGLFFWFPFFGLLDFLKFLLGTYPFGELQFFFLASKGEILINLA